MPPSRITKRAPAHSIDLCKAMLIIDKSYGRVLHTPSYPDGAELEGFFQPCKILAALQDCYQAERARARAGSYHGAVHTKYCAAWRQVTGAP